MISASTITSALVTKLKAISSLVTLVGVASQIKAYDEIGGLYNAIQQMKAPEILVAFQSMAPGRLGVMEVWQHTVSIIVRMDGDASAVLALICSGTCTGDQNKLRLTSISAGLFPMNTPSFSRRSLPMTESTSVDYWEITITIAENGDN